MSETKLTMRAVEANTKNNDEYIMKVSYLIVDSVMFFKLINFLILSSEIDL